MSYAKIITMMTRRQKVWRNRIIVFFIFPLAVILPIVLIDKKPVDERGVEVPEGLELNEQGFLVEKTDGGPTVEEETAWATAENGLPAGWAIWSDEISGRPVEKYAPVKDMPSFVVKIEATITDKLVRPYECVGPDDVVFCVVGNNPDVLRYFKVLKYYYEPEE